MLDVVLAGSEKGAVMFWLVFELIFDAMLAGCSDPTLFEKSTPIL